MWSDFHSSLWVKISKYLDAGWSFDLPFTRSPFDTFTNTLYKYFKQNMQKWNIQKCQTDMWCCPTMVTHVRRLTLLQIQIPDTNISNEICTNAKCQTDMRCCPTIVTPRAQVTPLSRTTPWIPSRGLEYDFPHRFHKISCEHFYHVFCGQVYNCFLWV